MSNHQKSIPIPVTLAAILAWEFCGNYWSDAAAFDSIHDFATDETHSWADRAAAIDHMSEQGMGVSRSAEERAMTDEEYVTSYLSED
ncbi:hypothetical protein UFOVP1254_38 [uncultured Caudovirales phage]|uniref:Uncharacterized protein n=1 Tax=uncultured Caudovirales phage TaxID=2100421 RepID=A0A6J5RRD6_9CAUD|nr:hypothetical protein UFOVP1254_38 [uncultured Caudovirales phage]